MSLEFKPKGIRVCYIGVWPLRDGLTQGSIVPSLRVLTSHPMVSQVFLLTLESKKNHCESEDLPQGVTWLSEQTHWGSSLRLGRLGAFLRLAWQARRAHCNLIIARGSQAGGIAWLTTRFSRTHFIVESYEPHREYMVDSGRWRPWGLRSLVQAFVENRIRRTASALVVVSPHYLDALESKKRKALGNLYYCPCVTDGKTFEYDSFSREVLRQSWGVSRTESVGIYLGKFGDIYFDMETALGFLVRLLELKVVDYFVFLGSGHRDLLLNMIREFGLPEERILISSVPHKEVAAYLSASDIAFSFVKPSPSRLYCSPVKTAEYWASGLPVVTAPGISTDSEIIAATELGAVWNIPDIDESDLNRLRALILEPRTRARVREICFPSRDLQRLNDLYREVLKAYS